MASELERLGGSGAPGPDDEHPTPNDEHPTPSTEELEALAGSLLWRIGREYEDGPVTVRVGFASAAPLFAELPRLRAANDHEVEAALSSGEVSVEWVGSKATVRP